MEPQTTPTDKPAVPKIYAAMAVLQAELARRGVGKDGTNREQGYKYRAWDDVQQALAAALTQAKVILIPNIESREVTAAQTARGTTIYRVVLRGSLHYISTEDGSQISFTAYGEAADSGDKATSKAMTMMVKYAVLHSLQIPLAGIEDADATTPPETVYEDQEAEKARATLAEAAQKGEQALRAAYRALPKDARVKIERSELEAMLAVAREVDALAAKETADNGTP